MKRYTGKRRQSSILAIALLTFGASGIAGGEPIAVIVNKGNPASVLSKNDLRPIFQTTKTSWNDGTHVAPINLPPDTDVRREFDQAVLGMDRERVEQYWTDRKIRGGERPPQKLPSAPVVLKIVASKREAVGYVPKSAVDATVKIVAWIKNGAVTPP
jgi:ABC-type phosphate transport system substrate-binding protein